MNNSSTTNTMNTNSESKIYNLIILDESGSMDHIRMQALSGGRAATDEACRLIVMNTASIQLLPTTVAALRAGLGSASPFAILPAVWATSLLSVSAGLLVARVLQKWL